MSHPRTRIRNKVIQIIKDSVDVNGRVYDNRSDQIFETETPIIIVYFKNDSVSDINSSLEIYDRVISMNVDIIHHSREGLYDLLDKLSWEVLVALLKDESLGLEPFVHHIKPTGDSIYNEELKEQYYGICQLNFEIKYDMCIYEPNATDDFERMHGSIDGVIEGAVNDAVIEFNTEINI